MGVSAVTFPGGVPFAGDDTAEVVQGTAGVTIDVLANDVGPADPALALDPASLASSSARPSAWPRGASIPTRASATIFYKPRLDHW